VIPVDPRLRRIGAELTERDIGWAVAGGWAIDLFLDRITRTHADVDVAVWRDEQMSLRPALAGWTFTVADAGRLRPWSEGEPIDRPLHELHARDPNGEAVEFLLNDRESGLWVYRRDATIRRPVSDVIGRNGRLQFLAPEIVLLYKSKAPRAIDADDFHNVLPSLSTDARRWLADALARVDKANPWIDALLDSFTS
jgi:hypothetical protein